MVTNDIAAVEGTAAPRKRARRKRTNVTKGAASDHTPQRGGSLTIPGKSMKPGALAFKNLLTAYPSLTVDNYIEQLRPFLEVAG